ncbi:MAG: hypothetical protein V1725_07170 [archaeon]
MAKQEVNVIAVLQVIINVIAAAGYLISIIMFGGAFSTAILSLVVLPLVIIDLVLCFFNDKKTFEYDIINIMMAALSLIPYVGIITSIAGIILSLIATVKAVTKT